MSWLFDWWLGTERKRNFAQFIGAVGPNDIFATTDKKRLFIGDHAVGPVNHGAVADEEAMTYLISSSARGVQVGDICFRSDTDSEWRCVANFGASASDWQEVKGAIRHTHANKTVIDELSDLGGVLKYRGATIGGGSRSLYSSVLSTVPTMASTGLTTWVNQGSATIEDTFEGIIITAPGIANDTPHMVVKAVPSATIWTATVLLSLTAISVSDPSVQFGFRDSATGKLSGMAIAGSNNLYVVDYSATYGASLRFNNVMYKRLAWLRLSVTATAVTFQWSENGVKWLDIYTVTKASGNLGSAGYNQLYFGASGYGGATSKAFGCLHSYAEVVA